MEPRNWDGASVDRSVLRRLRRLDKNLRVTFSPFALDTLTGNPIQKDGWGEQGEYLSGPCRDPGFYLWRKDNNSSHHFFVSSYPIAEGFGHLQVLRLEADLARFNSPEQVWRIVKGNQDRKLAAQARAQKADMADRVMDNKRLVMDVASGKQSTLRDPRTFSYPGQASRTVDPVVIPQLGPAIRPGQDVAAVVALVRLFRRLRPDIVHTHTAKAGALGRVAAWVAGVPVRIHTFHGHVLDGYFSSAVTHAFICAERTLARMTSAWSR